MLSFTFVCILAQSSELLRQKDFLSCVTFNWNRLKTVPTFHLIQILEKHRPVK